jgi:hypothetical protein
VSSLNDDLRRFTQAIVSDVALPAQINRAYLNYPADIALEVYRNNYRGNLHDALAGAYPVIEQLVGKEFFRGLTQAFIAQHPSRSGNLHHYGKELPAFIAKFTPAQSLAYLPDVATLEWACHCAYFAADAAGLDLRKLAQIPPEQYSNLILHSHPACHVVRSRYPVAAIWHAHPPGAIADAVDSFHIDLDSGSSIAVVIRNEDVVQVSDLVEAEADWLESLRAGVRLGSATDATLEKYPHFDLSQSLTKLVSLGVFSGFNLEETQ